jgi:hypothetical protein
MSTKIYLVGDQEAPKTNRWEAMTNNWDEASRLKTEMGPTATHKVVMVEPKRHTRASDASRRVRV